MPGIFSLLSCATEREWRYEVTKMSESAEQVFMKFDVKVMLHQT